METRIMKKVNNPDDRLLKVEEVSVMIGTSAPAINYWYRFKKAYPDNEYSRMLPNFIQNGGRQTRYWKQSDIPKLIAFRDNLPHGRNGVLSPVTQKYFRKRKEKERGENNIGL